ncbi:hypothetical protein [Corynebacterium sp.]|uniref:hypothetical protein n=1 Tax=Corynebacterium sp. TaxID=1720 RepID=UPI003B3BD419
MGNWESPSVPMFITQGAGGFIEGTPEHSEHGAGDGVMVTGDVRTLARQYCADGTQIEYREHAYLSHLIAAAPWLAEGYYWLEGHFNGKPATNNCSSIPEGNQL